MPGKKREADDQLSKAENVQEEMDLEFEDPWDDEFSDASDQEDQEEIEQNDENIEEMDDATNDKGKSITQLIL